MEEQIYQQTKKSIFKRFWWVGLILIVLIFLGLVLIYGAQKDKTREKEQSSEELLTAEKRPVLKNLSVEFAPFDPKTGKAGDFKFVDQGYETSTIFWEFGAILAEGTANAHMNPTFEYDVDLNTSVKAAADGEVAEMRYQEDTKDWELFIKPSKNSKWIVGYDHITNPTVKKGDVVTAGQKIGGVGPWNNALGRVELTVGEGQGDKFYSHCPLNFMDPAVKSEYEQKVARLMADYETWMKKPNIYDETKDKIPGCLYNRVVEEEGGTGATAVD